MNEPLGAGEIDRPTFRHYRAVLEKVGQLKCKVVSDSMRPVLNIGDIVNLEPIADPRTLRRFDIVVYHAGDRPNCHFVWNHNRLGSEPTIAMRSLKDPIGDEIPVGFASLLGRVVDHRIPWHIRARVLFANLRAGTA